MVSRRRDVLSALSWYFVSGIYFTNSVTVTAIGAAAVVYETRIHGEVLAECTSLGLEARARASRLRSGHEETRRPARSIFAE